MHKNNRGTEQPVHLCSLYSLPGRFQELIMDKSNSCVTEQADIALPGRKLRRQVFLISSITPENVICSVQTIIAACSLISEYVLHCLLTL